MLCGGLHTSPTTFSRYRLCSLNLTLCFSPSLSSSPSLPLHLSLFLSLFSSLSLSLCHSVSVASTTSLLLSSFLSLCLSRFLHLSSSLFLSVSLSQSLPPPLYISFYLPSISLIVEMSHLSEYSLLFLSSLSTLLSPSRSAGCHAPLHPLNLSITSPQQQQ
jgi:hypothetical protein